MINHEQIVYKDYGNCISITNGIVKVIVTTDFGPRIVFYGFVDGQNVLLDNRKLFENINDEPFKKYFGNEKYYNHYGGHRLWTSPEYYPEMYYPDNEKVQVDIISNGVILTPPPQTENGLQFKIKIELDQDDTNLKLEHTVTNFGERTKEFALWALSMSAKGGVEIIPLNNKDTKLLPNASITLWPYTDLRKDNIYLGKKYATIAQPKEGALKLGFNLQNGTVYYVVGDDVFIKNYYPNYPTGNYPDGGVSFETYSCANFTELETLSELKKVATGEKSVHVENWSLCKKPCDVDYKNDDSIDNFISKL